MQDYVNLEIIKKRGSSINPDIPHSKVFSSVEKVLRYPCLPSDDSDAELDMHDAAGNQGGSTPLSQLEILMQKMNQMEIQACARDAGVYVMLHGEIAAGWADLRTWAELSKTKDSYVLFTLVWRDVWDNDLGLNWSVDKQKIKIKHLFKTFLKDH